MSYNHAVIEDTMSGKPYQSSLNPYRDEIFALRRKKPPVSYARIAAILQQKYGLKVRRTAVGKFVKVRAKGRKVFFFKEESVVKKSIRLSANKTTQPQPIFNYTPSDRYNLTRISPEEAARRLKKIEEEGH
jgi:hypothetical protein